jgi:peptidoglycan/LPS O-acetylase OafA/YrhL
MIQSSSAFNDSKKHYELDGLRGVAAIVVVVFHIFETFSGGDHEKQIINPGYLAVDFFFVLSGFVIGYAYDDRWSKMSLGEFFKRRLIRLHRGMVSGA